VSAFAAGRLQHGWSSVKKVMMAEDDRFMADMFEQFLVAAGYEVSRTVNEGVELCEHHKPDLAAMDKLPTSRNPKASDDTRVGSAR
jgi:DNA-binding NarL/FixJ family response regulator